MTSARLHLHLAIAGVACASLSIFIPLIAVTLFPLSSPGAVGVVILLALVVTGPGLAAMACALEARRRTKNPWRDRRGEDALGVALVGLGLAALALTALRFVLFRPGI